MKRLIKLLMMLITIGVTYLLICTSAVAAPALENYQIASQPTGESFMVTQKGDEWLSYTATVSGDVLIQGTDGYWYYAVSNSNGYAQGSAKYSIDPKPANALTSSDMTAYREVPAETVAASQSVSAFGALGLQETSLSLPSPTGSEKILLILVSFTDETIVYPEATWSNAFFGSTGKTVATYYSDVSNGQFTFVAAEETSGIANNGVISVTLPYAHPNTGSSTGDANRQIVSDALTLADAFIDFSTFDTDHDGYIQTDELHIATVTAGYEAAYSADTPSVWAHHWSLWGTVPAPTLDGIVVGDGTHDSGYTQQGEIQSDHMATIGTLCHELGHDLGLPDLYDTDGTSSGAGIYSLMASGNWAYTPALGEEPGASPTYFDAWCRTELGWVTPTEVASTGNYSLYATSVLGITYNVLKIPTSDPEEYFLVENREFEGFDSALGTYMFNPGIAIWHIDDGVVSAQYASNSINNDETHKGVDLEEANYGLYGGSQLDDKNSLGQTYECLYNTTINALFGPLTAPNSSLYSTAATNISIDVPAAGNTMLVTVTLDSSDATLDFTAGTGTSLAGVVLTDNTAAESGADEANAMPLSVTIASTNAATAVFTPVTENATVTAYADDGTGSGTYAAVAANYDFSGANTTLWIKVVSKDTTNTLYYKLSVTVDAPSSDATLTSTIGTVDDGASTITAIPYGTTLAAFEAAITPAAGATFDVYEGDGTTVATDLATGYKVIVTAEDTTTTKTYTVTVLLNSDATLTSTIGTVDDGASTITAIPYGTTLAAFEAAITPATGATFDVYEGDGTTVATDLATGYKVIVTAQDTTTTKTYTVTLLPNNDATLTSTIGTVDDGASTITDIPNSTTLAAFEAAITPAAGATFDVYEGDGTTVATDLATGYKVIVTAQDTTTTKTYTVTVNVALSSDATLTSTIGTVDDGASTITNIPYGTTLAAFEAAITPAAAATFDVYEGDGTTVATDLATGYKVIVTAEDSTTKTYTITVNAPSSDATLTSTIGTVDDGASTITAIPYGTTLAAFEAAITPAAGATFDVYEGDGTTVATDLATGYKVIVTAQDTTTTKTYTITVNAPSSDATLTSTIGTVDDGASTITAIPDGTTLAAFEAAITPATGATFDVYEGDGTTVATDLATGYKVIVTAQDTTTTKTYTITILPNSDATLTSTIGTVDDGASTITAIPYGTTLAAFEAAITPATGATFDVYEGDGTTVATDLATGYKVIVTAQDTTTTKTYTITILPNSDATLTSTIGTVDDGASTITAIPYGTTLAAFEAAITPATGATFDVYEGDGTTVATDLATGYKVIVTAQDTTTTKTYTITILPNSDATLTSTIGTVDDGASTITAIPYGTTLAAFEAAITPATGATFDVYEGDGTTVATDLATGYKVIVTAQDTTTTKTYTITILPNSDATLTSTIGTVDDGASTITAIPYGTTLAAFEAAITPATGATFDVYEGDGTTVATDLATGYKVIVTAQDTTTTKTYTITVNAFVAVTDITGVPTAGTVGTAVTLTGTVAPADATYQTITWSVTSGAGTISGGNVLTATSAGVVVVTATITDGTAVGTDFTKDFNVSFTYVYTGGGGGGGDSTPDDGGEAPEVVAFEAGGITQASVSLTGTESSGTTTVLVTDDVITSLLNIVSEAESVGKETVIEINVTGTSGSNAVELIIPSEQFGQLASGSDANLQFNTDVGSLTFGAEAVEAIYAAAGGNDISITISQVDTSTLAASIQGEIGDRPVYDFSVTAGGSQISSFGGNSVMVEVPYTLQPGEDPNNIVIYYIDDSGNLTMVQNCVYDQLTGTVSFLTDHFSEYAVGYVSTDFDDVSGWYADSVNFLAARGIINGIGNNLFGPSDNITRAQFVTILANLSGDDLSIYTTSSFNDVKTTDWYFKAVQWAAENGIVLGTDGKFNPNATITRQDMAVILLRYANLIGYDLPEEFDAKSFADGNQIASYAQEAVTAMQMAGIISGYNDNRFAPSDSATRAEAAKMIAVFIQGMFE